MKRKQLWLGLVRYTLGITMIPYGLTKIFKTQMILGGYTLANPQIFEQVPGTTLTWAFLGYSGWFLMLLGFLELIPALLLLFTRTALLGATLLIPLTLNVFLINFALDLWAGTKIIATSLLTLNVLVFVFEWRRVMEITAIIIGRSLQLRLSKAEVIINTIVIGVAGYFSAAPLIELRNQRDELSGDWINQRPYEWVLQREEHADTTLRHRNLKLYFGPGKNYKVYENNEESDGGLYEKDDTSKHLKLSSYDGVEKEQCSFSIPSENELVIERIGRDSLKQKIRQYYWRRVLLEQRRN